MKKTQLFIVILLWVLSPIYGANINVTSPKGGKEFKVGDSLNIAWNGTGVSGDVRISLRRADGTGGEEIHKAHPFGSSPVFFKIPPTALKPGEAQAFFFVRIKKNATQGQSGTFKISASGGMLTLKKPNGGERWEKGVYKSITWDDMGVKGSVRLKLYRNNRELGIIADAGVSVAQKSYRWKVADHQRGSSGPGNNFRVGIETLDGKIKDMSDRDFEILPPSNVLRYDPNAGNSITSPPAPVFDITKNTLKPVIVEFKAYGTPEAGTPVQLYYHYKNAKKDFYIVNRTTGKKHTFLNAKYPEWKGSFFPSPLKNSRYEIGVDNDFGRTIDDVHVTVIEKFELTSFYTNKTSFYLNDDVDFWFKFKGAVYAYIDDIWNHETFKVIDLKGRYQVSDSCRILLDHPGNFVLYLVSRDGKKLSSKPIPINFTDPDPKLRKKIYEFKIDRVRGGGTISDMPCVYWKAHIMGAKSVEVYWKSPSGDKQIFFKKFPNYDRFKYHSVDDGNFLHWPFGNKWPKGATAQYSYKVYWWDNSPLTGRIITIK